MASHGVIAISTVILALLQLPTFLCVYKIGTMLLQSNVVELR